ncbi:MAG: response regulator [Candidatus Zixiibacteriota bacterium]|nr:MAG: response regulator [candidate division Zixibacteria bacterium]
MADTNTSLKLLLVDDEDDFRRATTKTLSRRGFTVSEAGCGEDALELIKRDRPDVILLDLKMPGMSGIETLQHIREIEPDLPVIILTGHGDFGTAMAGIKLEIVDFLQKPIDMEQLGMRIRSLLEQGREMPLRERTIAELMVPPSIYPRIYVDEPVAKALAALRKAFYTPIPEGVHPGQVRSALVFNRDEKFLGIIRFDDLLKLLLPPYLGDSPYSSFFTGMFLAQCKVIGNRKIDELIRGQVTVDIDTPLMEAVHLMVEHHLINLAVIKDGEIVGVLRGRDVILEVESSLGSL